MGRLLHEHSGDGIHQLLFDNPPKGDFDSEMTTALEDKLRRLAGHAGARVIILGGNLHDVFIRHFDLRELSQAAEALHASGGGDTQADWSSSPFHRITRLIETMPQIVIAAINGDCMGVGFELALACDLRIGPEKPVSIGLPEMHIAMFPGGGGTVRLARKLGSAKALELICTASTLSPQQALALGLLNRIAKNPLDEARCIAQKIASLSQSGIAAAKRIIRASEDLDIESALTLEQREVNARLGSNEVRWQLKRYAESGHDLRRPLQR